MEIDAKTAVAEPSPQPETDLGKFTPEQRDTFWEKGTLPTRAAEKTQEAAPADPPKEVDSEGKPKSAADPDTAESQERQKPKHQPKPDAEKRISELTARTRQLEQDLETERSRKREADTKPPAKDAKPDAPKYTRPKPFADATDDKGVGRYKTHDEYLDDLAKWHGEQLLEQYKLEQSQKEQLAHVNRQIDDARKRYPNADDVLKPALSSLLAPDAINPAVRHMIENSPAMFDLVYALGSDAASFQKFMTEAKNDPATAIRRVVITEKLVMEELAKGGSGKDAGKEDGKVRDASGKFVAQNDDKAGDKDDKNDSPAPPKTKAQKPLPEVGGRGSAPGDALESALKAGDTRAALAELDRRAGLK